MDKERKNIDLTSLQRKILVELLERYIPDTEVWAYGSRVKFTAKSYSDLDLVAFTTAEQKSALFALKEAFEESDLPFRVDLFCWDEVPEQFHKNIKKDKVVLFAGSRSMGCQPMNKGEPPLPPEMGDFELNIEPLHSLCELVIDCPHSTPKWTDSGVIVLRKKNIKKGVLNLSSPSYTNEEGYQKRIKRATPKAGDIVFTREAPMGDVCMVPEGVKCCLGQRQVLLRPKKEINNKYLFWALQSPYVLHQISWNEGTGTTVSNVRIPVLKELQIPRLYGQEDKIAEILSSLDNKIILNHQINKTLEEMAQALFKSWFVDFDPVRAKMIVREAGGTAEQANLAAMQVISGKTESQLDEMKTQQSEQYEELKATAELFPDAMQESELGEVPVGWEVKNISEMVELIGGGTPKRSEPLFWNGNILWFSVKDAPSNNNVFVINTEQKITEMGLQKSSTKLLLIGTTIITARGTVGKLALTGVPTAMNQSCYGVRGVNGVGPYLNYYNLSHVVVSLKQNTHGAVFDTITKDTFQTVSLVDPCINLKICFENRVSPLLDLIKNNLFEINYLTQLRDTLLPKLLSGELVSGGVGGSPTYEPKARAGCEKGA